MMDASSARVVRGDHVRPRSGAISPRARPPEALRLGGSGDRARIRRGHRGRGLVAVARDGSRGRPGHVFQGRGGPELRPVGGRPGLSRAIRRIAAHSRSGHARTLRWPKVGSARRLAGREVADPERPDVSWRFIFGTAISPRLTESGQNERFPIEYAFGSGRHAVTFVSLIDRDPAHPTILEHRLTHFAHGSALGLTPGQMATTRNVGNTPHGRVLRAPTRSSASPVTPPPPRTGGRRSWTKPR